MTTARRPPRPHGRPFAIARPAEPAQRLIDRLEAAGVELPAVAVRRACQENA